MGKSCNVIKLHAKLKEPKEQVKRLESERRKAAGLNHGGNGFLKPEHSKLISKFVEDWRKPMEECSFTNQTFSDIVKGGLIERILI